MQQKDLAFALALNKISGPALWCSFAISMMRQSFEYADVIPLWRKDEVTHGI